MIGPVWSIIVMRLDNVYKRKSRRTGIQTSLKEDDMKEY
jgi:hypothetical protein